MHSSQDECCQAEEKPGSPQALMINSHRRLFIKTAIAAIIVTPLGILFYKIGGLYHSGHSSSAIIIKIRSRLRYYESLDHNEQQSIRLYIDLLIPEDITPGALLMGIDQKIFNKAAEKLYYRQSLRAGLMHINQLAEKINHRPFYALNTSQANDILMLCEKMDKLSAGRILFDALRNDTMSYYYANRKNWKTMCFQGPPQPAGFLNAHLAPLKCSNS